jgi:Flp pilus assembly protein TadB
VVLTPLDAWTQYVHDSLFARLRSQTRVSRREVDSVLAFFISAILAVALAPIGALWAPSSPILPVAFLSALAALGFLYEAFREHVDERSGTNAAAVRAEVALSNGAPDAAARIAEPALASARSVSSRRRSSGPGVPRMHTPS